MTLQTRKIKRNFIVGTTPHIFINPQGDDAVAKFYDLNDMIIIDRKWYLNKENRKRLLKWALEMEKDIDA
jgi:hypothetical protein